MEAKTVFYIEEEIALQRKLEAEKDDRTDDNLQSIALRDLHTIRNVYESNSLLQAKSTRQNEIMRLIK